jgi:predicted O-methyltransferase YrrM
MTVDLRSRLAERLLALREEQAAGRRLLAELQDRQAQVLDTLLRLDGAVRVLEEELAREIPPARPAEPP